MDDELIDQIEFDDEPSEDDNPWEKEYMEMSSMRIK